MDGLAVGRSTPGEAGSDRGAAASTVVKTLTPDCNPFSGECILVVLFPVVLTDRRTSSLLKGAKEGKMVHNPKEE